MIAIPTATLFAAVSRWHIDGPGWQLRWPMPLWAVVSVAVALVLVSALSYRSRSKLSWQRRSILITLRAATLLLLLVMLGALAATRFQSQKPDLVVLLDDSASMQTPGQRDGAAGSTAASRFQQAAQILRADPQRLERLQQRYDLQWHLLNSPLDASQAAGVLDSPQSAAVHPSSPLGTRLSEILAAQRGRRTAAVMLLSDGIVTEGISLQAAADRVASQQIPIVAVGLGDDQPSVEVSVEDVLYDSWALVGDRIEIRASVRIAGVAAGRSVKVTLVDPSSGEVLDSTEMLAGDQPQVEPLTLTFVADAERTANLSVQAQEMPGERNVENNRRDVVIELRDQALKVLLVQDRPSYEFRFLKHLLERARSQGNDEPLVDLTVVLQSGDPAYAEQDRSAEILPPVGRERLAAFDTVILSDAAIPLLGNVFLSQLAEVVESQGVGLVVAAGPHHLPQELRDTPLEPLLPIDLDRVRAPVTMDTPVAMRLTILGQQTASMRLSEQVPPPLPMLTAVWQSGPLRPLARVLLETDEADPAPIVVTQLVGAGQVRLHLTDEIYRLQPFDGTGTLYERYWLQAIRELARGKRRAAEGTWELDVEGERFIQGVLVPIRANVPGSPPQVRVRVYAGDLERDVTLSRSDMGDDYRGSVSGLPPGDFSAVLVQPVVETDEPLSDRFVVTEPPSELDQLQSDFAALRQAAAATGGEFLSYEQAMGSELEAALPDIEPTKVQPLPAKPLWNHPLTATLLFLCLCSEWLLRRRWGML